MLIVSRRSPVRSEYAQTAQIESGLAVPVIVAVGGRPPGHTTEGLLVVAVPV